MSDFKFACPDCGQRISYDTSHCGTQIACPTCGKPLTVPAAPETGPLTSTVFVPLGQTTAPAQSAVPATAQSPPPLPISARSAGSAPPPAPSAHSAGPTPAPSPSARSADSTPPRPAPKPSLWELASAGQKAPAVSAPAKTGYSILAMVSLFCSVWVLLGFIPGIICGHLARAKMRENPQLKGRGMATAGLAISYAMLGLVAAVFGLFLLMGRIYRPIIMARESEAELAALKPRIVDEVKPGPAAAGGNESEHNLLNRGNSLSGTLTGHRWRTSSTGDGFSYDMKVLPDAAMSVNCRYYGSERGLRFFDIIVDNQIVGTQELNQDMPGHYFDVEYKIPASVTKGKSKVTVEFQAREGMTAGAIFAVETLRR